MTAYSIYKILFCLWKVNGIEEVPYRSRSRAAQRTRCTSDFISMVTRSARI